MTLKSFAQNVLPGLLAATALFVFAVAVVATLILGPRTPPSPPPPAETTLIETLPEGVKVYRVKQGATYLYVAVAADGKSVAITD